MGTPTQEQLSSIHNIWISKALNSSLMTDCYCMKKVPKVNAYLHLFVGSEPPASLGHILETQLYPKPHTKWFRF